MGTHSSQNLKGERPYPSEPVGGHQTGAGIASWTLSASTLLPSSTRNWTQEQWVGAFKMLTDKLAWSVGSTFGVRYSRGNLKDWAIRLAGKICGEYKAKSAWNSGQVSLESSPGVSRTSERGLPD